MIPRIVLVALLLVSNHLNAQLAVENAQTSGNSAQYYVENVLLGAGITALNCQFSTDSVQIGEFISINTSINMVDGLILSSGNTEDAPGPNNSGSFSSGLGAPGDSDLFILGGDPSFDAAVLEFDFVPTGDTLSFNYIFASEEYNEYVNGGVNDAFGFFLSGPGIAGGQGYENDAVNIALVPNTNIGVSINTVNLGSNSAYYINNDSLNTGTIEYDGLTVKLGAHYSVNCGDTYHIKLAIGDGGDGVFDSSVFLEGGSFSSNLIEINITSVNGDSTINEGCGRAEILFSRGDTTDTSISYISFVGTATNGVDFDSIPDTIILYPGDFDTIIVIEPYFDNIAEGVEYITIRCLNVSVCGDTFISEGTLYFYDVPDLHLLSSPDTSFDCPPDSLILSSFVQSGGPPPYTYTWNTGQTGSTISVNLSPNGGVDTFIVTAIDSCQLFSDKDTIYVFKNYADDPIVEIQNDTLVNCAGDSLKLNSIASFGTMPLTYEWSNGDTTVSTSVVVNSTSILILTITDSCGRTVVDTAFLGIKSPQNYFIRFPDSLRYCEGSDLNLLATAVGAVGPYTYSWQIPFIEESNQKTFTIHQDTIVQVYALDKCGRPANASVVIDAVKTDSLKASLSGGEAECSGTDFELSPLVTGGLRPYDYKWSLGDTDSVSLFTVNVSQNVVVTVTDVCGNRDTAGALISIPAIGPMSILISSDGKVCFGEAYEVQIQARGGAGGYRYEWTWGKDPLPGETFNEIENGRFIIASNQSNAHYFKAIDVCGNTTIDTVNIIVNHCLDMPNVITPNSDGINDVFYIPNILNFPDARLKVYSRWGQKVFDAQPYLNDWKPVELSDGVYFYILTSEFFPEFRGDVTVFTDEKR